jgi:hypothetical protein
MNKLGNIHLALQFRRFYSFELIILKNLTITEKMNWVTLSVYTSLLERF